MKRFAFAAAVAALTACGSRSSLPVDDAPSIVTDAGGHANPTDAGGIDAAVDDAGADAPTPEASARCTGRLAGWEEIDVLLGDDFQSLIAAAASETRGIWLAGAGRTEGQRATRLLRVEVKQRSPHIAESILLEGTEGWEPLALAVAPKNVALAARGANGEARIAIFGRDGSAQRLGTIEALQHDLSNRMEADIAFAGTDVVVAATRLGSPDDLIVERRDAALNLLWSEAPWHEPPTTSLSVRLRPDGSKLRTRVALYDIDAAGLHITRDPVNALAPIGAASAAWTGIDVGGFALERDDGTVVEGKWPGSQWGSNGSIPVYESAAGVFVTGNVELGPFIGWFGASDLEWIAVPRLGGGGVAFGDADNVGLFFAGIEIPRPEQPLRYWGCARF